MKNAITIANFYYQDLFENFSMNIEKNSFSVLSGPNNCGKTVLIRILNREIITKSDITIFENNINTYPIDIYSKLVSCVIPMEYLPKDVNIEEELNVYSIDSEEKEWLLKGLKMKRIIHKKINELSNKEFILFQLVVALAKKPRILLIDTISSYFNKNEILDIISFLKEYQQKEKITVLYIARKLEETLLADSLYIMNEKVIQLQDSPLEVLKNDNIINKIGLRLPFMIDLSVKLIDYDLIDSICLEQDRMVDDLWK